VRPSSRPWALPVGSCQLARGKNRLFESRLKVFQKIFLVFLDRQNVIAAAFNNLFGNRFLAEKSVARYDFIFPIYPVYTTST